jgi:signal transduction histidine kinase
LSTILSLSDDQRVVVERELAPLARAAAVGDLAADVAHDIANPLFGVLGLVDLLIEDAAADSDDEDRLLLLRQTALEMKATLRILLEFARTPDGEPAEASLEDAARQALELLRHGGGRSLAVEERYPPGPAIVPCPPGVLTEAVLHLLLAARETGRIELEVGDGSLRISPPPAESLGVLVATRIAVDHGGTVERAGGSLTLRWPS